MNRAVAAAIFVVLVAVVGSLGFLAYDVGTTLQNYQPSALPNPNLTPGDVLTADTVTVCKPGYAKTVRNVSFAEKRSVAKLYGYEYPISPDHEIDHLISLELGGSNATKNLWLEFADPRPGYHEKDVLENKMHSLVCSHQLDLVKAQHEIATNWLDAYYRYVKH